MAVSVLAISSSWAPGVGEVRRVSDECDDDAVDGRGRGVGAGVGAGGGEWGGVTQRVPSALVADCGRARTGGGGWVAAGGGGVGCGVRRRSEGRRGWKDG